MREIKFRAWDYQENKMMIGNNQYGSNEPDAVYSERSCGAFTRLWESIARFEDSKNRFLLMQYTGLKDKNGKEIYEGDIVIVDWNDSRYKPHNREVKWDNKNLCWVIEGGCLTIDYIHFEIIGNIYENPELLEELK